MSWLTRFSCILLVVLAGAARLSAQPADDDVWQQIRQAERWFTTHYGQIAALPEADTSYRLLFEAWMLTQPLPYGRDGLPLVSAQTLHPSEAVWPQIARWAGAAAHERVYELILQAGEARNDTDGEPRVARLFGLPYGRGPLSEDFIVAEFFASDDPVVQLSGEGFYYLSALEDLRRLVFAEAYRRAEAGNVAEACDLLVAWIRIGRQLADRQFLGEKVYGMGTMIESSKIMRNILYRHQSAMTVEQHREIVDHLGALLLERIRFPEADRWALMLLMRDTFVRRGGPREEAFVATFSRMQSLSAPLTRFQVTQQWQQAADRHAGYFETADKIGRLWGDWDFRWNIEDPYDIVVRGPTHYARMTPADRRAFAIIDVTMGPMEALAELRRNLQIAIGGTRVAVAVLGYRVRHRDWPANIDGIAPVHIPRIPVDPYDDRAQRTQRRFHYFVPVRDYPPVAPREVPQPYPVQLHSPVSGASPVVEFNRAGRYDDFFVYSKGRNLSNRFMAEDDPETGDIMIWPPLEELLRSRELWP